MKTCTIHILDEVNCTLGGLRPEDLDLLWDKFGFFVDGHFHMPAFQLRKWDGKARFFNKNGSTYTKLLDEIIPYLVTWGYDVQLNDKRIVPPKIDLRIDENIFELDDYKLRPYQVEVVNHLLEEGSGFAICATGSGKTSMCAALALSLYAYGIQTLVIVPSKDLVNQTVDEFKDHLRNVDGITVGEYSGGKKDIDHPIVVATWQSLKNASHYLSYFQAVIVDEAHGAKAAVIQELINVHGKHIAHRYGCTGTFPRGKVDQYTLKTSIGRIVREVPAKWLIEHGYLAEIAIDPVETLDEDPGMPDYAAEKAYLNKFDQRTEAIAEYIQQMAAEYGNTLVLVPTSSLAKGRALADLIEGSVYLDGGSKTEIRKLNYEQYAARDNVVVIASAGIASTGISIDRIFCLILVDTEKAFVKCIQSVGRGLRKKGDKTKIHVVDVYSKLKYAKKHYKDRKTYYTEACYPMNPVKKLKYI